VKEKHTALKEIERATGKMKKNKFAVEVFIQHPLIHVIYFSCQKQQQQQKKKKAGGGGGGVVGGPRTWKRFTYLNNCKTCGFFHFGKYKLYKYIFRYVYLYLYIYLFLFFTII